ncbi:hypothetical protein Dsin_001789 [Dipteronia sinensis]|uniref:HAT C-terminal dimerisation domain-containing protein n=1 Tax=Dipteronia sinensis TaxID=43782 RepID=A0AAE0B5F7_9ROSI|nr:hypothetical protein Dsin_001789 [Dipteronia sinensis]
MKKIVDDVSFKFHFAICNDHDVVCVGSPKTNMLKGTPTTCCHEDKQAKRAHKKGEGFTLMKKHSKTCTTIKGYLMDKLFAKVCSFREARNIDVPDMNARYVARRGRARQQQENYTIEQYYRVDIFYVAIDSQLQELKNQFIKTRRSTIYPLVHKIIVLVLTLLVSTTTTERSFSAMRIFKTRLHNKMEDDFLTNIFDHPKAATMEKQQTMANERESTEKKTKTSLKTQ